MLNVIVLTGRLTNEPKLFKSGTTDNVLGRFTIAVENKSRNPDGTTRGASFIDCVCFNATAESLAKFTKKGSLIGIEGSLVQRKFERQDGSNGSKLEVICDSVQFLEPKEKNEEHGEPLDLPEECDSPEECEKPKFDPYTGKPLNSKTKK